MSFKLIKTLAPNPSTNRGTFTSIATDPAGKKLVYCQSRTIVIRPLDSSESSTIVYAQHAHQTTVAKISPSGYYCASADISGNVRVWDLAGTDQVLKLETKALGGRITDLVWDGESKRIGIVGEGKDKFGHFFLLDSGSSCGEVTGHSKVANSIAIKTTRPYRAVTVGDDTNVIFYHGVPYKYAKSTSTHSGFVQSVAYAPDGSNFVSVGSDGKAYIYDGATGDVTGSLSDVGETAHKGTIFSCSFSPDSSQVVTCGAGGFLKVWEVKGKLVKSFDLNGKNTVSSNNKADDQLVGCTFAEGNSKVVAISLAGEINIVDVGSGNITKLHGATKSISAASLVRSAEGYIIAGSYDGRVLSYDDEGICTPIGASSSAVTGLAVESKSRSIWIVGLDDTLRKVSGGKFDSTAIATTGQPRSLASSSSGHVLVATTAGVDVFTGEPLNKTHCLFNESITAVACSEDGKQFAIGREDSKVLLCTLDSSSSHLKEEAKLENGRSTITALAFSPDSKYLAAGESSGKINVYDVKERKIKFTQWVFHTARINAIQFSPDGLQAVSASLDTNVYIWSTIKPMKSIAIKNAFPGGAHGACWLDNDRIASAGADGTVKIHSITRVAA